MKLRNRAGAAGTEPATPRLQQPSLRDRLRAFMQPTPAPVIVTSLDAWIALYGEKGWTVSVAFYPEYGYSASLRAEQNGGPLRCEISHRGHGSTLADAIAEVQKLVGVDAPNFASAHEDRKPKAVLVVAPTAANGEEGAP